MSDFKAKMHQIRFPPGLHLPYTPLVSLQCPPHLVTVFKGKEGKRRGGEQRGDEEVQGRERDVRAVETK